MNSEIEINDDFKKALELVENKDANVFITGRAGTGKSTFLNYFVENTKKNVVVLAPTGVAAVNVDGQTIHSFFGMPPGVTVSEAKEIARNKKKAAIFEKIELIIIDEISMVRADLLDCVDVFLKTVLRSKSPFGGKQMLFIGDLYQLPPVVKGEEKALFKGQYQSHYFFDAKVMGEFTCTLVEFGKIYRQTDKKFIELLNRVRNKTVLDADIICVNSRLKDCDDDKDYIYLTTTNQMAEEINAKKLLKINERQHLFKAQIDGEFEKESFPAEILLKLKRGAQVMFLVNDQSRRWVNGTIGVIDDINKKTVQATLHNGKIVKVSPHTWEIFKYKYNPGSQSIEKETTGTFTQYPLRLAWAITIHKSQGKTFDKVIVDIGKGTFATGQLYVALSRCTALEGLKIKTPIQKQNIFTDWKIPKYLTKIQYEQASQKFKGDKRQVIQQAIQEKRQITIVYLKPNDEKTLRTITPIEIKKMEYLGHTFEGLEAYCHTRKDNRNFKLERILEIKENE